VQYWRPTAEYDAVHIANNMRQEDILEVAAFNRDPLSALLIGMEHSYVCMTLVSPEGEPGAMLGVTPGEYDMFGKIWLLGTPLIEQYGFRFLRHSRELLQEFYETTGHDAYYNYTHKDNHVHHKWLRWLGFKFLRRVTIGNSGFLEFCRLKD